MNLFLNDMLGEQRAIRIWAEFDAIVKFEQIDFPDHMYTIWHLKAKAGLTVYFEFWSAWRKNFSVNIFAIYFVLNKSISHPERCLYLPNTNICAKSII